MKSNQAHEESRNQEINANNKNKYLLIRLFLYSLCGFSCTVCSVPFVLLLYAPSSYPGFLCSKVEMFCLVFSLFEESIFSPFFIVFKRAMTDSDGKQAYIHTIRLLFLSPFLLSLDKFQTRIRAQVPSTVSPPFSKFEW